jgi:hypothetical protein
MGGRVAILLALLFNSIGCAKEIPLSGIWALQMPGTKNVQDLEPEHYGKSQQGLSEEERLEHLTESLTYQIPQIINQKVESKPIGEGFVVTGSGKKALSNVKSALESGAPETLPANTELALFFYAREFGSRVHLKHVERSENDITIEFAFVSHGLKMMSNHFALIPLGKLPPGEYHVNIIPSIRNRSGTADNPERAYSLAKEYVSQPFVFSIK